MKNKEDTTMKKFMTDIKTLAALLMAGAAFTACSSDDNIIEQPQNPTEPQVYTMVIKASKGGDTTTRALQPGYDDVLGKNTVDAYWSGDETIEVYQSGEKIGEATAAPSANGNSTITAELTSAPNPSSDLDFYLGGKTPDYTGQVGLLTGTNSISENYDYATDLVYSGAYTVDEINKKITPNEGSLPLTFGAAQQAIIKFTLKDKANDAAISPSALTVTDGTSTVELTSIPAATYTANGGDNNVLYVAFPAAGSAKTITLTATVGDDTYTYETATTKTFTNGQYYDITVKMMKMKKLGKFSVSSTKQVYFSLGNLQATNATANSEDGWVWSFAEHQYDIIGNATANNAVGNNVVTTAGTVDLFGWVGATSELAAYGINNNTTLLDYSTSTSDVLKSDWGTLPIVNGGNKANSGWRTPSCAEWEYVLTGRTDAASKVGFATVGGQNGIIILPDEFTDPMKNGGSGAFVPKATTGYGANVYTAGGDWEAMEANGAVFLPSAGGRLANEVAIGVNQSIYNTSNSHGGYWSSTCTYGGGYNIPQYTRACYVKLFSNAVSVGTGTNTQQRYGLSVRLVRDVE